MAEAIGISVIVLGTMAVCYVWDAAHYWWDGITDFILRRWAKNGRNPES